MDRVLGFKAQAQRAACAFKAFAKGGRGDSQQCGRALAVAVLIIIGTDGQREGLGEFRAAVRQSFQQPGLTITGASCAHGVFQARQFRLLQHHLALVFAAVLAPLVAHDPPHA